LIKCRVVDFRNESSETGGTPSTIPHSEVALIVNDVFDPMYGYHEGDESKAVELKKRFLGLREKLKSLVNPTVIVKYSLTGGSGKSCKLFGRFVKRASLSLFLWSASERIAAGFHN
jgi:hypothetical protein